MWKIKGSRRNSDGRCSKGECIYDTSRSLLTVLYSCQEVLAEMVHTKDGSRVVREFLAQGTAKVSLLVLTDAYGLIYISKDRKQIVKVLKPHVERMCTDDEAQLVLFTALDVIE